MLCAQERGLDSHQLFMCLAAVHYKQGGADLQSQADLDKHDSSARHQACTDPEQAAQLGFATSCTPPVLQGCIIASQYSTMVPATFIMVLASPFTSVHCHQCVLNSPEFQYEYDMLAGPHPSPHSFSFDALMFKLVCVPPCQFHVSLQALYLA